MATVKRPDGRPGDEPMVFMAIAEVVEVVDGDTFHANLDIGWGIMLRPRRPESTDGIRGIGTVRVLYRDARPYDSPETSTLAGRDARTYARTLAKPGERLIVTSFALDDFGRTLGAVTLPDGRDWAAAMHAAGHVKGR